MRFIGITGGVGAGKSTVLEILSRMPKTKVMLADKIAHELMMPGTQCYDTIRQVFATEDIYDADGMLNRKKLAEIIFSDTEKRQQMNAIVHPAVKQYVIAHYRAEQKKGELEYLFLEAALLIEEHYDEICDELWYIYTDRDIRCNRLMQSRGYSREKAEHIFASQLSDSEYREKCAHVLTNNGSIEEIEIQLRRLLHEEN